MSELSSLMKSLKLFDGLADHTLEEISSFTRLSIYEAGQTILAQGLPPGDFYVIYEGNAEVVLDNKQKEKVSLALLGSGEYFGEMSILTGELTSAAIVAVETCKVLIIAKEGFASMLALIPELSGDLVKTLSLRLRRVNQGVWEARNKEISLKLLMDEEKKGKYREIIGNNKDIKKIKENLPKWSSSNIPLCLEGERGTGKELIARSIHSAGQREGKPFFSVDCGSLDSDTLGEKLFGQFGYLELADQGTLLLKDADLLGPSNLQRLVEFLEQPLVDVRIMFASREALRQKYEQEDLDAGIPEKLFSNVIKIIPLRQRKRDVPDLIQYYLGSYAKKYGKPLPTVSKDAMEKLLSYDYYQGNVSELKEVLKRSFLLAEEDIISSEHVFLGIVPRTAPGINLLRFKPLISIIQKGIYPGFFQYVVAIAFLSILILCFFGTKEPNKNWGTLFAWSLGWPVFVLSAVVFGRIACSVCPISFISTRVQKIFHFSNPIPSILKKYDFFIITFLFMFIFWIEEVTDMRNSPTATGILFLSIVTGAIVTALFFPRHTWCRHLCPLGGMFGICSMSSYVELRSNPELCLNKCTTHNCFKGDDQVAGCPLFQHAPFIDSNQSCKLCLNCVRSCPNGSVQLNIRPPAREIWSLSRVNRNMVLFVVSFLIIIFPLTIFDGLRITLVPSEWLKWFTVFYWSSILTVISVTLFFVANRFNDDKFLPQIRSFYAFVPLAAGAHVAYQLKFLPAVHNISVSMFYIFSGTQSVELLGISILRFLIVASLTIGFLISIFCAWKISKTVSTSKFLFIKNTAAMITCFTLFTYTLLANI